MSARSTGMFSLMHRYCCFTREPQVCSRLKPTLDELSVAEYSFTGIDTSPKLSDSEAMERAAMGAPLRSAAEAADYSDSATKGARAPLCRLTRVALLPLRLLQQRIVHDAQRLRGLLADRPRRRQCGRAAVAGRGLQDVPQHRPVARIAVG